MLLGTLPMDQHMLQVTGMVERPAEFTVPELINLLPSYTIPVTLVCAGVPLLASRQSLFYLTC